MAKADEQRVDAMTDEQVTLCLASLGCSPEDVRRAFERAARSPGGIAGWLSDSPGTLFQFAAPEGTR